MEPVPSLRKNLADNLAKGRKRKGWTQHDLAAEAEMSVGGVQGYEQQKRWPDPEDMEKLARALGDTPIGLLSGPGSTPPITPEDLFSVLRELLSDPAFYEQLCVLTSAFPEKLKQRIGRDKF